MRILLADDVPMALRAVSMILTDAGHTVVEAATPAQAIVRCHHRQLDLLITDIHMPGGMDGWSLGERVRDILPGLPVIYMTGYSDVTPRPVPRSAFLRKPIRTAQLLGAIDQLTAGCPSHEERQGGR